MSMMLTWMMRSRPLNAVSELTGRSAYPPLLSCLKGHAASSFHYHPQPSFDLSETGHSSRFKDHEVFMRHNFSAGNVIFCGDFDDREPVHAMSISA